MGSRGDMFKMAGELIDILDRIDKKYFISTEIDGKIYLAEDIETWSPKLLVWGGE